MCRLHVLPLMHWLFAVQEQKPLTQVPEGHVTVALHARGPQVPELPLQASVAPH